MFLLGLLFSVGISYHLLSSYPSHIRCILVMGFGFLDWVPEGDRAHRTVSVGNPESCHELLVVVGGFR